MPRTLFGRIALVIALVSLAIQAFTIAVVTDLALMPLGRLATSELSALMFAAAHEWRAADAAGRARLQQRFASEYRLQVQDPPRALPPASRSLPYFRLLEAALAARAGTGVPLLHEVAADGRAWTWADLPSGGARVRVGFAAERIAVQPSLALLLALGVGGVLTLVTAALMARWLVAPLARLAGATGAIGQGRRPAPLPEDGPRELATLARAFNRMGSQVEQLLANRTTLLAGISHDLRSPLARMRLALGMLSEKPDADLVERLVRDVDAMNELIARCLELGRDVSAREAVDLDLAALLAELAAAHAPGDAEVRWRPHAECRLRAPPLALRRVVSNLLDNAVRYGGGQPVDIELRCAADAVEVQVLDRGPGIPEAEREAVFQPFHRLEASRSRRTGGSGLGLAIVRQIADANGWSVTLGPRAGGGTAACLRLPLAATMAARRYPWST